MARWINYLKPYWISTLLAPLLMLVEVYMDLLQPKLMASIVNEGVMKRDLAHIQHTGGWMLVAALIGLAGGVGCTVFSSIASQRFGADVRKDVFAKVQTFSFRNLDRFPSGSLVTRLTNDVAQVQNLVQMTLRILVRSPFLAVGSCIMAFTVSPRLALILVVSIPILFATQYVLIRASFPLYARVQSKLDRVNTVLQENLSGIRVVKAFVRSAFENGRFGRANTDYMDVAVKASRIVAINMPIMMLIMNASIVAVLWFGADLNGRGSLPIGDLVAFINYVTTMLSSLLMVGMMMVFVSRAKASAERIREVLDTQPDIADLPGARDGVITEGRIEFDRVSFGYDPARTGNELTDITFTAEPGRTIAVLGATGSGKSTLVHLVSRLYDVTGGAIRIDGVDVRHIRLGHLRGQVATVLQQAILFSGTILDNIRYGKPDATREEIETAARAAQAHEFISRLPDGYDTVIGQRGVNLSGGQKQRLSIARALLVRPKILILDDSTSAVDLGTESRIQRALQELMRASTTIVIAQRISSVMEADRILVLEEGRLVAAGRHDELMRTSPVYRDICESQLGKEEIGHGGIA
ncbi:ABC transporter ATP-binding protein [Paenibacillus flagellatus]|uniref:Multidrug ABC transporter ATP-binding protein n=1 Tax=Paenibacillus flagellatus TaxID=2211139 RepID=A0A2V5KEU3_9BACL|nr:ABC transporter ATP-binding protein [Paenibacillus flagellatus]PYI52530.1 multidrug ABC transporter ATP-binding protein [Paenibacillus flagellatus]